MLPIHALSIRTCATMFPPSSATAMFMGWPISVAFFSAALITRRASSNFTAVMGSPLGRFSGYRLPAFAAAPHYVTQANSRTAMQEVDDQVCRRLRLLFRDPVPAIRDDHIL